MGKNVVYAEPLGILNLFCAHTKAPAHDVRVKQKSANHFNLKSIISAMDEVHNVQNRGLGFCVSPKS